MDLVIVVLGWILLALGAIVVSCCLYGTARRYLRKEKTHGLVKLHTDDYYFLDGNRNASEDEWRELRRQVEADVKSLPRDKYEDLIQRIREKTEYARGREHGIRAAQADMLHVIPQSLMTLDLYHALLDHGTLSKQVFTIGTVYPSRYQILLGPYIDKLLEDGSDSSVQEALSIRNRLIEADGYGLRRFETFIREYRLTDAWNTMVYECLPSYNWDLLIGLREFDNEDFDRLVRKAEMGDETSSYILWRLRNLEKSQRFEEYLSERGYESLPLPESDDGSSEFNEELVFEEPEEQLQD